MRVVCFLGAVLLCFALVSACDLGTPEVNRVTYHDEELVLVDVADGGSYSRTLTVGAGSRAAKAAKPAPGGSTITYVAEVEPPEDPLGKKLQASHIALSSDAKYAIVSYMLRGEGSSGAVDIFDVSKPSKPVLLKSTIIPNFDISVVVEESKKLYLAGQRIDDSGARNHAFVMAVDYSTSTGELNMDAAATYALPGYFATDLVRQNGLLYVTTGAYSPEQPNIGLFALKLESGALTVDASNVSGYPDLRSVAVGGSDLAVFEAQFASPASTCRLDIYSGGTLGSLSKSVNLSSFPAQAEAKSKVGYYGGLFFVAANQSGVAIVNPVDGTVKASIPAPSIAGLSLELQASNAVSSGNAGGTADILLIANGEAGLWVGDGTAIKSQSGSSLANISGSIRFGAGESVNYVASKSTLAVAAVGTGGLKILNIAVK